MDVKEMRQNCRKASALSENDSDDFVCERRVASGRGREREREGDRVRGGWRKRRVDVPSGEKE